MRRAVALLFLQGVFIVQQGFGATNSLEFSSLQSEGRGLCDQPAVSSLNGKISYTGGDMDSNEGHNLEGSFSLPVSLRYGVQVDGLYSRVGGLDFYGAACHLFWRNPTVGLIGFAGGYLHRTGVDAFQVGSEGEFYLGNFTFGAFVGVGNIAYDMWVPFIDTDVTKLIGQLSINWYPLNDLRLGGIYNRSFDNDLFKANVEYQIVVPGLVITAEFAIGDHNYEHWLVGVRYYFGAKKALRLRHREDDPQSLMPQILHSLGVYGAEYNRKGNAYVKTVLGSLAGEPYQSYGLVSIHWARDTYENLHGEVNRHIFGQIFGLQELHMDNIAERVPYKVFYRESAREMGLRKARVDRTQQLNFSWGDLPPGFSLDDEFMAP